MRVGKRLRWRIGFLRVAVAQVRTGRPPEARAAFQRLREAGVPAWRSYRLLAAAYEAEVATMILEERVYDHAAYVGHLNRLPDAPTVSLEAVQTRRAT
jgi:hypothetical protein